MVKQYMPDCDYVGCERVSVNVRREYRTQDEFKFCNRHDPLDDPEYADYWE